MSQTWQKRLSDHLSDLGPIYVLVAFFALLVTFTVTVLIHDERESRRDSQECLDRGGVKVLLDKNAPMCLIEGKLEPLRRIR